MGGFLSEMNVICVTRETMVVSWVTCALSALQAREGDVHRTRRRGVMVESETQH